MGGWPEGQREAGVRAAVAATGTVVSSVRVMAWGLLIAATMPLFRGFRKDRGSPLSLGCRRRLGHSGLVKPSKTVINLDDPAGRTVGRRRPPADALAMGAALQTTVNQLLAACGHKIARKGVYRFHSHQEADEWLRTSTTPARNP